MSYTSKSPVAVARHALRAAGRALRPYAHKFSPKKFTQPQLFACLVLKTFFSRKRCQAGPEKVPAGKGAPNRSH